MTKYNTVSEAYNAYKNSPVAVLEARSAAIAADVKSNVDADIAAYNIELEGIEAVINEKRGGDPAATAGVKHPGDVAMTAAAEHKADDKAATKVYRSAFFKTLQGKKLESAEQAAFNEVNGEKRAAAFNKLSNSAAVIPTTTLNEIVTKARDKGGILGISRGFNMPANIAIPVATPGSAASWHTEGANVDGEKVDPASVTFGANEIMRILSISAAVETMSISAFESYLVDELNSSVMATLAKAMVDGTGSGQGTGIVSGITWGDDNSVTVAKSSDLAYSDILAAIAKLHRGYSNGAKFVMNNATLYTQVYGLHDDNSTPIYVTDLTKAGAGRILGFDVVIDDFMPDGTILFGNFGYMGYNMPAGIALDVSRESSFTKGLIDFRALAIADCKPIVPEAFVKIAKATD